MDRILAVFLVLAVSLVAVNAGLPQTEIAALTDLANAFTSKPSSWNISDVDNACSSWQGVGCVDGHVFVLNLPNASLAGSLPASIAAFTQMQTLNLRGNALIGPLPPALGVSTLIVNLAYNQFTGSLPAGWSSLGLTTLLLNHNNLTGCVPASWPGNLNQSLSIEVGLGCDLSSNEWDCGNSTCYENAPTLCQSGSANPMCPVSGEAPHAPFVYHMTPVQIAGTCVGAALIIFLVAFFVWKFGCKNNQRAKYEAI
eukprot:TRINITY_DN10276_c0_g1_i1.p1 TRINITY_DN10276_c0_g1~~TRINITY_DN10276_c0_g1_i1.p1  ORF type:complete len:255 (-),score=40.67 TRINITY_DN10276_c0_g1_i1:63-827(-)